MAPDWRPSGAKPAPNRRPTGAVSTCTILLLQLELYDCLRCYSNIHFIPINITIRLLARCYSISNTHFIPINTAIRLLEMLF